MLGTPSAQFSEARSSP
ncbi:hypothetical protein LINPERHAP1_LOCUS15393 [Linum perenne]